MGGGTKVVNLSTFNNTDTDDQTLSISGSDLTISEGNTVALPADLVDDADADPTNEQITVAELNGTDLEITEGGTVITADLSSLNGGSSLWTENGSDIYHNTGNVGIGNVTPEHKLHVQGAIASVSNGPLFLLQDLNASANNKKFQFALDAGNLRWQALTDAGADGGDYIEIKRSAQQVTSLDFYDNASLKNRISVAGDSYLTSGNFGIGINAPFYPLHVSGNSSSAIINMTNNDGTGDAVTALRSVSGNVRHQYVLAGVGTWYTGVDRGDTNKFKIDWNDSTLATPAMTLTTDGKVGIGTSDPTQKFHLDLQGGNQMYSELTGGSSQHLNWVIDSDNSHTGNRGNLTFKSGGSGLGHISMYSNMGTAGVMALRTFNTTSDIVIQPDDVESVRFKVGGNVGIGTNSPNEKLHVNGGIILSTAVVTAADGTIQFDEGKFQAKEGGTWHDLIGEGGSSLWTENGSDIHYNAGRIGIGIASPTFALDVQKNQTDLGRFYNSIGDAKLRLVAGNTNNARFQFLDQNSWISEIAASDNNDLQFRVQNSGDEVSLSTANVMTLTGLGRVGIGTETPAELLHVYGSDPDLKLYDPSNTGNSGIRLQNSLQHWRLYNYGAPNSFLIRDVTAGKNILTLEKGAPSNSFYMQSSGELGLGTNNPGVKLHVVGDQYLASNGSEGDHAFLKIGTDRNTTSGLSYLDFIGSGIEGLGLRLIRMSGANADSEIEHVGTGELHLKVRNSGALKFSTNFNAVGTSALFIENNQNIGIGIEQPEVQLHLKAFNETTGQILIEGGKVSAGNAEINSELLFGTNDSSIPTPTLGGKISSITESNTGDKVGLSFYTYDGTAVMGEEFTEKMRIRGNGTVECNNSGTTLISKMTRTDVSDTYLGFHAASGEPQIRFHRNTFQDWALGNDTGNFKISSNSNVGSEEFVIIPSGNVGIGTSTPMQKLHVIGNILASGSISPNSDRRLKKDIQAIDKGLEKVLSLEGVDFTFKANNEKSSGFIAQDIETVLPHLVQTASDEEALKSVNYMAVTAYLVEAIKEQQKQIELLKAEVKKLKD